jgi:hypothetical protein
LLLKVGGKIIVLNSSSVAKGQKDDLTALDPDQQLYALGLGLTTDLISCDIVQNARQQVNILTLNEITNACNGGVYLFKNYNIDNHYVTLYNTILRIITRNTGWEALAKINMSKSFKLAEIYTPVLRKDNILILPTIDRYLEINIAIRLIHFQ